MTVRLSGTVILLEGDCFIEDAEPLAALLQTPGRVVDLSQCRRAHTALLQALLVFRPNLTGAAQDAGLSAVLDANLLRAP